jgi:GntR family transcriptional regulator
LIEFRIRRGAAVPVRDQIRAQIELAILTGALTPGNRLPSVRVLARRLDTHANTISHAYRDLEKSGHVALKSGSGVFVRPRPGARSGPSPSEKLREAVRSALESGLSPEDVQHAVALFVRGDSLEGVVVVEPSLEMAAIYASEIRSALGADVTTLELKELEAVRAAPPGRLVAVLPYHVARAEAFVARDRLVVFTLSTPDLSDIDSKGDGAGLVTVISPSPMLLSFARVFLSGGLGSGFHVETCLLQDAPTWRRLLPASDVVFADAVALPALPPRTKNVRPLRLVSADSLRRIETALRR